MPERGIGSGIRIGITANDHASLRHVIRLCCRFCGSQPTLCSRGSSALLFCQCESVRQRDHGSDVRQQALFWSEQSKFHSIDSGLRSPSQRNAQSCTYDRRRAVDCPIECNGVLSLTIPRLSG
jgi:hypothetical protein